MHVAVADGSCPTKLWISFRSFTVSFLDVESLDLRCQVVAESCSGGLLP